ncbi:MAG: hypothetical protein C4560_00545 [Nitrospiraceae bacterium]|nr:MAG: hypothetical protein C4560_00545 [Nitrospiraceae bacterium]
MNIYESAITEPFQKFYEKVIQFLPNLLTSVFILIGGIAAGFLLKGLLSRLFRAVGLDRVSERSGAAELLKKGGFKDTLSVLLARLIGWITVVIFAVISMSALNVPAFERLFERFFLYLPNIFVAGLTLLFGYLLSNFFGRTALIASVNAGAMLSSLIGRFVKYTIFIFSATMALEQLGIGKETVVIAFAIVFGGVVLALAIAFGLGGRDIAKDYLEKKIRCEEKKDEISHL